ncbi:MAG: prolyl oligopeptidase family serine peptidase [Acidobacteriota bacterium]
MARSLRSWLASALCAAAVCLATAAAAASATHPFSVRDLVMMDRVSAPVVSPDGKTVVFVLRTTDLEANKGRTHLWAVGSDGSGLRQLTTATASDSSPAYSPDGAGVYFLSARSGSSQVWRLPLGGGEAEQVTRLPLDVDSFQISRDGKLLAVSMAVFSDCVDLACTKARLDERAASKATGRIYEHLFVRHWDTWEDGRRNHVFVVPVAGGAAVDLMKGMEADAPSKPFGGSEEYTFTPDGKGVVFTTKNLRLSEEAWSTNFDLFYAPADGSTAPRDLTAGNPATDTQPAFSPDGTTLAWLAMKRPGFESDRQRIVLRAWPDGAERVLTEAWDRSPGEIVWSRDGKEIYTSADNLGQHSLFAIDVSSGKVRTLVPEGHVEAEAAAGDRIVYSLAHFRSPADLYVIDRDGRGGTRLTEVNAQRLAAVRMGEAETMTFKGAGGDTVYAFVMKPADFDPAKKYPVAFLIHGGPQGSFGNQFHYRWNPQTYAGAGYGVVMVDFHGSTGYGQKFTDAISGDWGGKPLEDLKLGLAAALAKNKWLDGDRVCALGASYGGYMVNYIAGAWPDRFRCLVVHDGEIDTRYSYFDTDELWFPEWEHGGAPWNNPAGAVKYSPIDLVKNWRTPTLVVHGEQDFRLPYTHGLAVFTALQRKGIPSKLLVFPDENHFVLKPQNSIQWHDTVIGWLDRWTKK